MFYLLSVFGRAIIFNLLSFAEMHETISNCLEKESLVTTFKTSSQGVYFSVFDWQEIITLSK